MEESAPRRQGGSAHWEGLFSGLEAWPEERRMAGLCITLKKRRQQKVVLFLDCGLCLPALHHVRFGACRKAGVGGVPTILPDPEEPSIWEFAHFSFWQPA